MATSLSPGSARAAGPGLTTDDAAAQLARSGTAIETVLPKISHDTDLAELATKSILVTFIAQSETIAPDSATMKNVIETQTTVNQTQVVGSSQRPVGIQSAKFLALPREIRAIILEFSMAIDDGTMEAGLHESKLIGFGNNNRLRAVNQAQYSCQDLWRYNSSLEFSANPNLRMDQQLLYKPSLVASINEFSKTIRRVDIQGNVGPMWTEPTSKLRVLMNFAQDIPNISINFYLEDWDCRTDTVADFLLVAVVIMTACRGKKTISASRKAAVVHTWKAAGAIRDLQNLRFYPKDKFDDRLIRAKMYHAKKVNPRLTYLDKYEAHKDFGKGSKDGLLGTIKEWFEEGL